MLTVAMTVSILRMRTNHYCISIVAQNAFSDDGGAIAEQLLVHSIALHALVHDAMCISQPAVNN